MSSKKKPTATQNEAMPLLVPRRRFPEFRMHGPWKLTPLRDLAERGKTKNRDEKIQRVLTNSAEFGVVDQRDFFDKDIATQGKLESYVVVELGDYVYNPRISATAPVGPISKNQIGTGVMSPLYTVFRFKNTENSFFQHYFKTTGWHTYMRQASSTGARHDRMAISSDDFMAMPLPVAPAPEEQQRIADCLDSVDELIAAQARKLDALKTHKKGLMQQFFPREGETQPRLRFSEFQGAGEWAESKLLSLSNEPLSNGVFNDPQKVGSGYKLINVSDMYIETTIDESRLPLLELLPSEFAGNQVITGDIFFTRSSLVKSGIAVSNIYLGSSNDVTYDGHLIRFRPSTSKVVPLFVYYLFKTEPIRAQLIARGKTATMTTIGQADVASVTLFYPDKAEQQRIASCLSSVDALITAETQKYEALKTHKKGLMQQLFPSVEKVAR